MLGPRQRPEPPQHGVQHALNQSRLLPPMQRQSQLGGTSQETGTHLRGGYGALLTWYVNTPTAISSSEKSVESLTVPAAAFGGGGF